VSISLHLILQSVEGTLNRVEPGSILRQSQTHDLPAEEVFLHKVVIVNSSVVHDVHSSLSQCFVLLIFLSVIVSEFVKNALQLLKESSERDCCVSSSSELCKEVAIISESADSRTHRTLFESSHGILESWIDPDLRNQLSMVEGDFVNPDEATSFQDHMLEDCSEPKSIPLNVRFQGST